MSRKIWVIAEKDEIEQVDINNATLNGCPEIANGIPPALFGIVSEAQLPYAYEEPKLPPLEPTRDLAAEIDVLKARIEKLEMK